MLTKEVSTQINNFVAQKPRTIQEISQLIQKNWRTADSYVQRIAEEQGTLSVRTLREGTRGALKIVYWNLILKNQSTFQESLFNCIITAKHKSDFSPFDIYQYVEEDNRECFLEQQEHNLNVKHDLIGTLISAQQQVLIFSGDLSWAQAKQGKDPLIKAFKILAKRGISIKVIANVDLNSSSNVSKINTINHELGKELIEIRHNQQPLRAFIIDNSSARLKEKYFLKRSSSDHYLFYSITDEDWVRWMQKVFWHFFSTSISAEKRIKDLKTVREL